MNYNTLSSGEGDPSQEHARAALSVISEAFTSPPASQFFGSFEPALALVEQTPDRIQSITDIPTLAAVCMAEACRTIGYVQDAVTSGDLRANASRSYRSRE